MKRILFCAITTFLIAGCSKDGGTGNNNTGNGGNGNGGGGTGGGSGGGGGTAYAPKFVAANNFFVVYNGEQKPSAVKTEDIDGNTNLRIAAAENGELRIVFHNLNNPTATQSGPDYIVSVDGMKVVATAAAFNAAASDTTNVPHAHIFNPNGAAITVNGVQHSQIVSTLVKLQSSSAVNNGKVVQKGTNLSTMTSFPLSQAVDAVINTNSPHHVNQQKFIIQ
jgi:hypothetical protein